MSFHIKSLDIAKNSGKVVVGPGKFSLSKTCKSFQAIDSDCVERDLNSHFPVTGALRCSLQFHF